MLDVEKPNGQALSFSLVLCWRTGCGHPRSQPLATKADSGLLYRAPAFTAPSLPLQAVANQPVSVAIEADQREFQLYAGGIFDAPCGTQLDHGVLLVGYGTDTGKNSTNSTDYWVMKNSW